MTSSQKESLIQSLLDIVGTLVEKRIHKEDWKRISWMENILINYMKYTLVNELEIEEMGINPNDEIGKIKVVFNEELLSTLNRYHEMHERIIEDIVVYFLMWIQALDQMISDEELHHQMMGGLKDFMNLSIQVYSRKRVRTAMDDLTNAYVIRMDNMSRDRNQYMEIFESLPYPVMILNEKGDLTILNISGVEFYNLLLSDIKFVDFNHNLLDYLDLQTFANTPSESYAQVHHQLDGKDLTLEIYKNNWGYSNERGFMVLNRNKS